MLDVLRDAALGEQQKFERLVALLSGPIDLDLVARLILGRHWRTASAAQQAEYLELFRAFALHTLASRLDVYGGQDFEITGAKVVGRDDALVSSRILSDGPPLKVDWRVRAARRRQPGRDRRDRRGGQPDRDPALGVRRGGRAPRPRRPARRAAPPRRDPRLSVASGGRGGAGPAANSRDAARLRRGRSGARAGTRRRTSQWGAAGADALRTESLEGLTEPGRARRCGSGSWRGRL